ncbi:hypothetical protein GR160_02845 [Flavobacterium sp. Sd200]|uniref:hypothetical protein n=1 Tax=Flavobacterium sp. Sd200 TaxID=2692211 RepID=UPI00136F86EB|nr:hypothetical protein [Flavobacterium sp. Sd200]MXN90151.1 hypothetical protein [Flavobacterium sp. Sd200]
MKTKILTLCLFIVSFFAIGQTIDSQGNVNRANKYMGGMWFTTATVLPTGNHDALYPNLPLKGRTQINATTGRLEYNDGNTWFTLALDYTNNVSTISVSPTFGEKGVSVPVTVTYNIASNSDQFTAASINQGIGSVLANINTGNRTAAGGSRTATTTFTLSMTYNRLSVVTNESKSATYTGHVPQWMGISATDDFTTYAAISADAGLQKFIQASGAMTRPLSPSAQYVWVFTTNSTGKVYDQNNFEQTEGAWNNGTTEFYTKSITITLQDGTTATVYAKRTRLPKTLTNQNYRTN